MHPPVLKPNESVKNTKFEQKSELKDNTTMETTPNLSSIVLNKLDTMKTELTSKIISVPMRQRTGILNNLSVSEQKFDKTSTFNTPGYKKRRLTRDSNNQIDSTNNLFNFKKEEIKTTSLPAISLVKPNQVDPLNKILNKPEEGSSKVKKSIDFLQRLSGNIKDEESKIPSKNIFVIPEFKPKSDIQKDSSPGEILLSSRKEKPSKHEEDGTGDKPQLSKVIETNINSDFNNDTVSDAKIMKTEDNSIISQDKVEETTAADRKAKEKGNKVKRSKYTSKNNKLLSVIVEENKLLSEFLPTEKVDKSPYFNNIILGFNRVIIQFSSKPTSL